MAVDPFEPRPRLYPAIHPLVDAKKEGWLSAAIIMRTRDRPLLLTRALESVCSQTHPHWHLYLVNDGGAREPVEALLRRHAASLEGRLTFLHHAKPQGLWPAANAALRQAREDLVVIHDDDDAWAPDFLGAVSAFLGNPANDHFIGVTTGCTLVTERIEDDEVREVERTLWPHGRGIVDFRKALVEAQLPPICLAFRRDAVEAIGGFNSDLKVLGDWEFNLRLLLLGEIGFIDQALAFYHHRVKGTNSSYSNTVVDRVPDRTTQHVRLRNGMLRAALADRPELIGVVHALLYALNEHAPPDAQPRLNRIEHGIAALADHVHALDANLRALDANLQDTRIVAASHRKMLRPMHWAWGRLLPLRRRIARARGRIPDAPPPAIVPEPSVQPAPSAESQSPASAPPQLWMSEPEGAAFRRLLSASEGCYLEWGAGGSTCAALESGRQRIISVESDPAWIATLEGLDQIGPALRDGVLTLVHAPIGKVRDWGFPRDEENKALWPLYPAAPWPILEAEGIWPELVLVDGRFRVACALSVAVRAREQPDRPAPLLVLHDAGPERPAYDAVLPFWEKAAETGTLWELRLRKDVGLEALHAAYRSHIFEAG